MIRTDHKSKLSTTERRKLNPSDFGLPKEREFPMPDAAHVHAAETYFHYAPDTKKPLLAHRILLKAKKFGIDIRNSMIADWAKKYKNKRG